jgi:cytochrome c
MKQSDCCLIAVVCLLFSAPVLADEALAKSRSCLACHSLDKKLVGPAYKEIAKKYAGQKDAEDQLAARILAGSKGVWTKELGAEIAMPPSPHVKPEEAIRLSKWILGLKRQRS